MNVITSINRSGKIPPPTSQLRWTEIKPGEYDVLNYDVFLIATSGSRYRESAFITFDEYFRFCHDHEISAWLCTPLPVPSVPDKPEAGPQSPTESPRLFYEAVRFVGSVMGVSEPFEASSGKRCRSICLDVSLRPGQPTPLKYLGGRSLWNVEVIEMDPDKDSFMLVPPINSLQLDINSGTVVPTTWTWNAETSVMNYALGADVEGYDRSYDFLTQAFTMYDIQANRFEAVLSCGYSAWPLMSWHLQGSSREYYYNMEVDMSRPLALAQRNAQDPVKTMWLCMAQGPAGGPRYARYFLWSPDDPMSYGNTEYGIVTLLVMGPQKVVWKPST